MYMYIFGTHGISAPGFTHTYGARQAFGFIKSEEAISGLCNPLSAWLCVNFLGSNCHQCGLAWCDMARRGVMSPGADVAGDVCGKKMMMMKRRRRGALFNPSPVGKPLHPPSSNQCRHERNLPYPHLSPISNQQGRQDYAEIQRVVPSD